MLNAVQLLNIGFQGPQIGSLIKESKIDGWTSEEIETFLTTKVKPLREKDDFSIKEDSVLEWFINNPCVKDLLGSSNSQKRRWLQEGAVLLNGKRADCDDEMPTNINELIFFPSSKLKITMI